MVATTYVESCKLSTLFRRKPFRHADCFLILLLKGEANLAKQITSHFPYWKGATYLLSDPLYDKLKSKHFSFMVNVHSPMVY